jgi:uncharacterized protein YkwD/ribosomal protein L24E
MDFCRRARGRIAGFATATLVAALLTAAGSVALDTALAPAAGAVTYLGSAAGTHLNAPIVGMASTPTGKGYWLVASDGGIFRYGDAGFYGSAGGIHLNKPIVGMAATPTGKGYWLVASDGGIFRYGDAGFYGSMGGRALNKPVVGMASTPTGKGYWLVASDGGIFRFGDANFYGSTGGIRLNKPIVGMSATPSGHGYWLVASDGGIFRFGTATFYGSTGSRHLLAPVIAMAKVPNGAGYWLLGRDGAIYNFGTAKFYGSGTTVIGGQPAAAFAAPPANDGYWITTNAGAVNTGSATGMTLDPHFPTSGEAGISFEIVNRINLERITRGSQPLYLDPALQYAAMAWAHHLGATKTFEHENLASLLAATGLQQDAENLFMGAGPGAMDAGTAHVALMHSDPHRANMLYSAEQLVGIGASCVNSELVVVELFGTPWGVNLPPNPVPPPNPVASSDEGGASC